MTGLFIYVYSFYFYFHRSGMSGLLQSSFYFGYMAVVSFAFFLMLGSAAFQFSLIFVKYIYWKDQERLKRNVIGVLRENIHMGFVVRINKTK